MSFDRDGKRSIFKVDGVWRLQEFGVSDRRTLLTLEDDVVEDILISADGEHAVAHVWVEFDGTYVLTSEWMALPPT